MNNLPAFPSNRETECMGMTLRDYFAAKAMQGIVAAGINDYQVNGVSLGADNSLLGEAAYYLADAMLKARGL